MTMQTEQHDRDVEQALRRTRFTTPADLDEQILGDATRELRAARQPSAPSRVWRRAAVILLALGAAAALVAYFDRPSLTLAQVSDAYAKQKWVHVKYDNGREEWTDLTDGRHFFKDHDGRAVYTERNGLRLWWWGPEATYISKDKWYRGDAPPPSDRAATPWDQFVKPYESSAATTKPSGAPSIERHEDTLDGRKVIRFDCFYTDAIKRRLLVDQVWADPATRLPVQHREVLQLAERQEQKRDAIVGTYDFPATGPSSIHDLGVPQGLAIIDAEAKPANDVAKVLEAGKSARARFPSRYHLVVWTPEDSMGFVDDVYRDGERFAHTRYFVSDQEGVQPFPKNAAIEQVRVWLGTRLPVQITIDDGTREFSRSNNIYNEPNKPAATARVMTSPKFPDDPNRPPGTSWPYLYSGSTATLVPDAPAGLVILRSERGDQRTDYTIDPSHDYICLREARQNRVNGQWMDDRVETFGDLKQLEGGQWYAASRRLEHAANAKLKTSASTHVERIYLKPLTAEEIPLGTFKGEKLLDGAKVETY